MSRTAVFLDRDGVLTKEVFYDWTGEWEAALSPDDLEVLPKVTDSLRWLSNAGYALILISNQAAAAKGKTSLRALWQVHETFCKRMSAEGISFSDSFYSFSHPCGVAGPLSGPSLDRKPSPYGVLVSAAKNDIALDRSWFIGDRETDVKCGRSAGTRTIRIVNPRHHGIRPTEPAPDYMACDMAAAAQIIMEADQVVSPSRC